MWTHIEKQKCTFPLYWYIVPALLLFLLISHIAHTPHIILCKTFDICDNNPHGKQARVKPQHQDLATPILLPRVREGETRITREKINSSNLQMKRKIVIYSVPRSGSSFLGEMLNRRKDVFYMYEPLHTLKTFSRLKIFPQSEYPLRARRMLQNILNCRFHKYKDHLSFLSHPELCNPHYRLMSKVLSSPPFCRESVASNATQAEYEKNCFTLYPQLVSQLCFRKQHIVVKELVHRLPLRSIDGILELLTDPLLHIICLIRDPRAIVSSIRNIGGMNYADNDTVKRSYKLSQSRNNETNAASNSSTHVIEHVCSTLNEHYRILHKGNQLVRKKLIAVRYEDIVSLPTTTVQKLFHFLHFDADKDSVRWVVRNTHGHGRSSDNALDSFSVHSRNVTYSLNSWRSVLMFEEVMLIQEKCGAVMEKFGYVLYENQIQLQDMQMLPFRAWR